MYTEHVQILQNLQGQVPDDLINVLRTLLGNCTQDLVNRGQVEASIDGTNADKPNLEAAPVVPYWTDDEVYAALKGYNTPSYIGVDIDDGVNNGFAGDFKGVVRIKMGGGGNVAINRVANIGLIIVNQIGGAGGIWANIGDENNYIENAYITNLHVTNFSPPSNTGFGNGTATVDSSGSGPYTITGFYYTSGTAAAITGFTNPRGHIWRIGDAIYLGYNGQSGNWEVIDVPLRQTPVQTSAAVDGANQKLQYTVKSYALETLGTEAGSTTDYHTGTACP